MTRELSAGARAKLDTYLHDVAQAMASSAMAQADIDAVVEGLKDQVTETLAASEATGEADMVALLATLDPPQAFGLPASSKDEPAVRTISHLRVLGTLSAVACLVSLVLGMALSREKPFDSELSGTIFVFGQMIALAAGLAALRDPWGRFGTIASALMLGFLVIVFLFTM